MRYLTLNRLLTWLHLIFEWHSMPSFHDIRSGPGIIHHGRERTHGKLHDVCRAYNESTMHTRTHTHTITHTYDAQFVVHINLVRCQISPLPHRVPHFRSRSTGRPSVLNLFSSVLRKCEKNVRKIWEIAWNLCSANAFGRTASPLLIAVAITFQSVTLLGPLSIR